MQGNKKGYKDAGYKTIDDNGKYYYKEIWECEFCDITFKTTGHYRQIEPKCPKCHRNKDVIPVDDEIGEDGKIITVRCFKGE